MTTAEYPRCSSCGRRFPAPDFLERHQERACTGRVGERRVMLERLRPNDRAAFSRWLREWL